jgi:tetratricopeptide (TPR) repeat protein
MNLFADPHVWGYVYLAELTILSLALGCLTLYQPRLLAVNSASRFLIGFCITPYAIGIWMMIAAIVMPNGPRWLFLLIPLILAFFLLILYIPRIYLDIIQPKLRKRNVLNLFDTPILAMYLSAIFLLAILTIRLGMNGRFALTAHDALFYSAEALFFANDRTYTTIQGNLESTDGSLRADNHGFIFPAYLSHALLHTASDSLGYPNDYALRWSFQITIVYMLLAILALAALFRAPGVGAMSIILLLQVPQFEYISYASSRDAFRIISLLLFTILLASFSPSNIRYKPSVSRLISLMILSMFSFMGHTLGAIVVVMQVLAWLFWVRWWNISLWRNIVMINIAIILGLFVGGIHYPIRYLLTHSFLKESTGRNALQGTPIEFAINPSTTDDRVSAMNSTKIERFITILQLDQGKLSNPGLIFSAISILLIKRFRKERGQFALSPFVGLIGFITMLSFSGLLDSEVYSLSRAFASNIRYLLHWYPYLAIVVSSLLLYVYKYLIRYGQGILATSSVCFLTAVVLIVTYSAYKTLDVSWRVANQEEEKLFISRVEGFTNILNTMPGDERIFMNDGRYTYYLGRQVMVRFSISSWPITRAKNEDEVRKALGGLKVGAVMLNANEIRGWWDKLPLYSYLNNTPNIVRVFSNSKYQVYRIIRNEQERSQTIQACMEKKICDLPPDSLFLIASRLHPEYGNDGYFYSSKGNWKKVEEIFNRAAHSYPSDLSIRWILCKAYKEQGKFNDLYACYQKILSLTGNSEAIVKYIAADLAIAPDYLFRFLSVGEFYQSPINSNISNNFLDDMKISNYDTYFVKRSSFIIGGFPLGVIYQHPPYDLAYRVMIPNNSKFSFFIALAPQVWNIGKGDGVQFDIKLDDEQTQHNIFSSYIDPKNNPSQRRWTENKIDMSYWAGQAVTITFSTGCGPNANCDYDWAGWGEPRISQPVEYDFLQELPAAQFIDLGNSDVYTDTMTVNYEERPIIFQHPTSRIEYSLDLPRQSTLAFGFSMASEVWSQDKGDGVEFNIYVRKPDEPYKLYLVFRKYIDPKNNPDDRRWFDERLDLSRFGGQNVKIIFETRPGQNSNLNYDWAGWSRPVLIDETLPESAVINRANPTP